MPGQPSVTDWNFNLGTVVATEAAGLAPGVIVNSPNTFTLTTPIINTGGLSPSLVGATGVVHYHCERIENGARVTLPATTFVKTAGPSQAVTSAPINTSGGPSALSVGTWEITTHVHFPGTSFAPIVSAFNQILLEVI
jgi:hypothetical protein